MVTLGEGQSSSSLLAIGPAEISVRRGRRAAMNNILPNYREQMRVNYKGVQGVSALYI